MKWDARLVFAILSRVAKYGNTAVILLAEARLNASIIRNSSMRFESTGGHVGWMMKTSAPRTFSRI
jgi:hypothetical protein